MTSPAEVYVLTTGSYSDYRIVAVYTSRAAAEEAQRCEGEESNIEVYFPDPPLGHTHPEGMTFYEVSMLRDGDVVELHTAPHVLDRATPYSWSLPRKAWVFRMWAKNPDHAFKIAGEYRTRVLAANLWDTPIEYYGGTTRIKEFLEQVEAAIG